MTEELRIKILELWQKSMSGGEIASYLGISRNSVIGVVHRARRNGEPLRGYQSKQQKPLPAKKVKEKPVEGFSRFVEKTKPIKKENKIEEIVEPVKSAPTLESCEVTIDGLMHYSCRFIVKEGNHETTKYCGKNKDKSSYCKEHYDLCYTPARFSTQKLLNI